MPQVRQSLKKVFVVLLLSMSGLVVGAGVTSVDTVSQVRASCENDICDTHRGAGSCFDTAGTIDKGCDMTGPSSCADYACGEGGGNGLYPRQKH